MSPLQRSVGFRGGRLVPAAPLLVAVLAAFAASPAIAPRAHARQTGYPKLSPFEAVEWNDAEPHVQVEGAWYELVSIDGTPVEEIVRFCRERYSRTSRLQGAEWRKRFEEDLVEVLHRMERPPDGRHVDLVVGDDSGAEVRLERVEMTAENRQRIWQAARLRAGDAPADPTRLRAVLEARRAARSGPLTREEAERDLARLAELIETRYSYRDLVGFDWRGALAALRHGLGATVERGAFALGIAELLARFGDGHTRLELFDLPPGYAPFLPARFGGRLYAFEPDRSGLLDAGFPILLAIDGVPVERWLEAAGRWAVDGSPQLRAFQTERFLRHVVFLRTLLDLPARDTVTLLLGRQEDGATREKVLPIVATKPLYGIWPAGRSRRLDGDIGYLRLASMAPAEQISDELIETMNRFRDTEGLILDLRGNGGGSRDALRILLPYLLEDDQVAVVNAARYRLDRLDDPAAPEGYLADRYLFPLASKRWSPGERAAIERLREVGELSWTPAGIELSDWHYFTISRDDNPAAYRYREPVAVLLDAGCFSATDVFLGAFSAQPGPRVWLIGEPSGGGSGRSLSYELPASGLRVRLSSMVSYRPYWRLYERHGVFPDRVVEAVPTDFTGETDTVLDAAREHLRALIDSR